MKKGSQPTRKPRIDALRNRERILDVAKGAFTRHGADASLRGFAISMPPREALRAWLLLFIEYIAAKHIIAPALNTVAGGATRLYEGSRGLVQEAIEDLVKRAKKSGDVRRDIDASDLLRAVIGVSYVSTGGDWQKSAKRLVGILIAGSRPAE